MIDHTTIDVFKEFFLKEDKERVIYGCGQNGMVFINWLNKYMKNNELEVKIARCVDGNKVVQSTLFADKYIIEDPSVLIGKQEKYKVIITPERPEKLCKIIESYGYQKNVNYITMEIVEMISYALLFEYLEKKNYNFKCVLAPDLFAKSELTEIEKSIKGMNLIFDDNDRMDWLRSAPPHIKLCHKELEYFSKEYVENIFFHIESYERDGVMYTRDYRSKYVNCIGGMRFTTDQPDKYKKRIHMYGSSLVYGIGVEDKYTIPSCLQRLLNKDGKEVMVLNHGVRGIRPEQLLSKIQNTHFEEGDICLLYLGNKKKIKEFLMLNKVPFIDGNYFLREPLPFEVFYDTKSHMTYQGNQYITQCFYNMMYGGVDISLGQIVRNKTFDLSDNKEAQDSLLNKDKKNGNENKDKINAQLSEALSKLRGYKEELEENSVVGSIVMNCNPFTLGHYHLIQIASKIVDFLYIFVVEEDKSEFSFQDRIDLVRKGTSEIKNVKVLPSGQYIISSVTFPEYFDKEENQILNLNLSEDIEIFGKYIAPIFDISIRFVGEEITDVVTRQYNETMKKLLPAHGVKLLEIPRARYKGKHISASTVRRLYHEGKYDELRGYVPDTTFDFLTT